MAKDEKATYIDRLQAPIIPVAAIGFHCKTSWLGPKKKVPVFVGDSGVGKTTEIERVITEDMGWHAEIVPMANFTESAEWGTMIPDEKMTALYPLIANFLQEILDSEKPGVLVLDDVGRCDDRVLKHIFSLVDTRMRKFMQFRLPPEWAVALTMNPATGLYDSSPKFRDPAIRRRLRWFWVDPSAEDFLRYAAKKKRMFPPLLHCLRSIPSVIHDVRTRDANEGPYGCPAAWDDVDDVIKGMLKHPDAASLGGLSRKQMEMLEQTVGSMVGMPTAALVVSYLEKNEGAVDPQELLVKYYKKQSAVRRKVLFHLEQCNNAVISELTAAVALALKDQPKPETVSASLAVFLDDLQNAGMRDLMQIFFRCLRPVPSDTVAYRDYLEKLGKLMHQQPAFKNAAEALRDGMTRVKDDLASTSSHS